MVKKPRIGVLFSRVRVEEKWIFASLERRGLETVVAVLPDHPTPVEKRIHVRDAVPFVIRDPRQAPDGVARFDEVSCATGSFGTLHGDAFIRAVEGGVPPSIGLDDGRRALVIADAAVRSAKQDWVHSWDRRSLSPTRSRLNSSRWAPCAR